MGPAHRDRGADVQCAYRTQLEMSHAYMSHIYMSHIVAYRAQLMVESSPSPEP